MASTNFSFSAQVAAFAEKAEAAVEDVFKSSVQDVVREMQALRSQGGRMRYNSGFLQGSLLASTAAMPAINPSAKPIDGQSYSFDFGQIEAVIAGAALGDTLYFGYTAAYAGHREYGSRGQPPDAFVRSAAQNWPIIVDRNAARRTQALGL